MTYGTPAADLLLSRSTIRAWGNPVFGCDDAAGGVYPGEGQLLYGLVRAIRPRRILEIGTGHGLSTIYLAAGCRDNEMTCHVWTVEINRERWEAAGSNIAGAGLAGWVVSTDQWPTEGVYDLVLLDAGHTLDEVSDYLERIKPLISSAAVVIIHDAVWKGHARQAAGTEWAYIELPDSSFAGLAILQRIGTQQELHDG
jgi:predicted O-methyltransferase YrrM